MAIDIVFEKPPGPDSQFVEVEDADGNSIKIGTWIEREDGYHVLRIDSEELLVGKKVRLSVIDEYKDDGDAPKIPGVYKSYAHEGVECWSIDLEAIADLQGLADRSSSVVSVKFSPGMVEPLITRHISNFEKKKRWKQLSEEKEGQRVRDLCSDAALFGEPDPEQREKTRNAIIKTNSQLRAEQESLNAQVQTRIGSIRAMARAPIALGAMMEEKNSEFWNEVREMVVQLQDNLPAILDLDNEVDNLSEWLAENKMNTEGFYRMLLRSFIMASLAEDKLRAPDDSGLMDKIAELAKDRE
jgi:hypothetical protein